MKQLILILSVLFWLGSGGNSLAAQSFDTLDEAERRAMADTFQYSLENNPTSQNSEWVNPDSTHSGEVRPLKTFYNSNGEPCREFTQTIIIGEREEQGYGTACRQPDGIWQIVTEQRPAAALNRVEPTERRTVVYLTNTPWPNYFLYRHSPPYGYWYPYYYPSSFSFSFNYLYHRSNDYKRSHIKPRHNPGNYSPPYKFRTDFDRYNRSGSDRWREERIEQKYRDKKERQQQHRNKSEKRERREDEREGRR